MQALTLLHCWWAAVVHVPYFHAFSYNHTCIAGGSGQAYMYMYMYM